MLPQAHRRTRFTVVLTEAAVFPAPMVPRPGIEPRSARYQRAALPLCYQGVAEHGGIEPRTLQCLRFSKPLGEPTPACSRLAEGGCTRSPDLSVPARFERAPAPWLVHLPYWRSVIGIEPSTLRLPGASNTVEEPTSARSVLAEPDRIERLTLRPLHVSNVCGEPTPAGSLCLVLRVRFERTLPDF